MTGIGDRIAKHREERAAAKKRKEEVDEKFSKWVDSLTWWKLAKYGVKTVLLLMGIGLVAGLIIGVPIWLLWKLFFVVLP
jgi:hypothetical protein